MNLVGVLCLVLYAAGILHLARRGAKSACVDSFFVNSRSSSPVSVALSIVVSCVGASATIGVVGMAFRVGTPAFWWLGMGALGLVLLAFALAKKVRTSGALTMPQLVESLMGPRARTLVALIVLIAWIAILAAQFTALSRVLQGMLGLGSPACLVIGYALVVVHSLGGQAAIMRTDRVQFLIILSVLLFILAWLSQINPGWSGRVNFELYNSDFPASMVLYFMFVVGGNYVVCPTLFGRLLSAKSSAGAKSGAVLGALGLAGCSSIIVAIGLGAVGLVPASTPEDAVLSTLAMQHMPEWLGILVSVALLSAIVSSADSCLVTVSTVFSFDLLGKNSVNHSRVSLLGIGLAGLLASLLGQSILAYLLMAYDIYLCGVVVPVFIALTISHTRFRINPVFACAAIGIGGICGAVSGIGGITQMSYVGMGCSAAICMCGVLYENRKGNLKDIRFTQIQGQALAPAGARQCRIR